MIKNLSQVAPLSRITRNISRMLGLAYRLTGIEKRALPELHLANVALVSVLPQRKFSTTAPVRQELMDRDNVWRSPYPDVHIPDDVNVAHQILDKLGKFGNRIALVDAITGQEMTYGQLQTNVTRVASALVKQGFEKGDTLTLFTPNCPEVCIVFLAVLALGGIPSAVNNMYKSDELVHALTHLGTKIVATVPELMPITKEAITNCQSVESIIVFGDGAADGFRPLSSLVADDGSAFPDNLDIEPKKHIGALLYSSGTTGPPKGVMLSHYNLTAMMQQMKYKDIMPHAVEDTFVAILPMFHLFGLLGVLFHGLSQGSKFVTLPKFEPDQFLRAWQDYRATYLHLVPPIVLFVANHPRVAQFDLSSTHSILCSAAPVSLEVCHEFRQKVSQDLIFRQAFGMTEMGLSNISPCDSSRIALQNVGPALPNVKEKVIDLKTRKALGPGEEGEILVKSPGVMLGYMNNELATKDTLSDDGWLRTGDIGHMDTDGCLVITDKLKELIKYKGFQVAPAELEHLLLTHPAVQDAAVIGMPDDRAGELPRAYVVLKPNQSASQEDIQNYVKEKAAAYKQFRGGVEFRKEIPKSVSGKILRRCLKNELLQKK